MKPIVPEVPGRTTRMLKHAIRLHQMNHTVYVMAADQWHASRLKEKLRGLPGGADTANIHIVYSLPHLNWEKMAVEVGEVNCVVLADHHTIECRFARMLTMLYQYDEGRPDVVVEPAFEPEEKT